MNSHFLDNPHGLTNLGSSHSVMEKDRRDHPRIKARVPVELFVESSNTPVRCATSDISLSGCYIESIFPFPVGTNLEIKLQINDTLVVLATVVSCDPQVGNGIKFTRMLPEDVQELEAFIDGAESGSRTLA